MARDSLFNERVIWTGRPQAVETPGVVRAAALLSFVAAAISTVFAGIKALALGASPGGSLLFAGWCVTIGCFCLWSPAIWLRSLRYTITEHHVIWQRGPFRRSIERGAISFARIFWSKHTPGVGDIELVRAVPTGALRRRLALRLSGVSAPDRVWAIVRGQQDVAPIGHGERPLSQRLDRDERVIWSAKPRTLLSAYLPHGRREWSMLALAAMLVASLSAMLWRAVPSIERLLAAGLPARSATFVALVVAQGLTALMLISAAVYLVYDAIIRGGRQLRQTRYLITNKRVLIQRGREELHLDRDRIVDVIDTPAGVGLKNVFLVLDGPRARALAASGAFGEVARSPHLRPVFRSLDDADSVSRILREPSQPELPRAA